MLFRVMYKNGNNRLLEANTQKEVEDYTRFPEQIKLYGEVHWIANAEQRLIQADISVDKVLDLFTDIHSGGPKARLLIMDFETGEVLWCTDDALQNPDDVCPIHILRMSVLDISLRKEYIYLYV